jgi:hypothetical protein
MRILGAALVLSITALSSGCATQKPFDYTAFKQANPRTILVLPPKNSSPEVTASYGYLARATMPLAESGYYVLPVTMVDQTFKNNGISSPDLMHDVSLDKLREIFKADTVLYINILEYGTKFMVFDSAAIVTAEARLVDAQTGKELWSGKAGASSAEGRNNQGSLAVLLVSAVVKQIAGTVTDESYRTSAIAAGRLLSSSTPNGILPGPMSPNYWKK